MMARLFVLCLALLLPAKLAALSCLPWQVEDAYTRAAQSPEPYFIVRGRLDFDQNAMPAVDWEKQDEVPQQTLIKARLDGKSLGRNGFRTPFRGPVDLIVSCAGPWCPSATAGSEVLAFVKRTGNGSMVEMGACGGMLFQQPDRGMLKRVRACLAADGCTPPRF